MSIIAAEIREREERYDYAAEILRDVLRSRIKSYIRRIELEKQDHADPA